MLSQENIQTPLHVYLTYDAHSLPEYGPNVVVLLLGEEYGLIPRYVRHVRAVFKTHRLRPVLGSATWWRLDHLHLVLWLKFIRNCLFHARSRIEVSFAPNEWPSRVHSKIRVLDVPVGYCRQDLLEQKSMQERPFHCFFAGGVSLKTRFWRKLMPSPKVIARRQMLAVVRELERNNARFSFDGGEAENPRTRRAQDLRTYSQRFMDSKICLAPRGTAIDTWRFFEGLRAGCLVVCEHLTSEWFYDGAPVLRVQDWRQLPKVIESFLNNDAALERARLESLAWWTDKCGEKAVGRAMAAYLVSEGICEEAAGNETSYSRMAVGASLRSNQ